MLINSCAKINLFLKVLNKRPDGYHNIDTIFSTVDLYDSLKFVLTKKPEIKILSNIPELASTNNLVYKIAKRIKSDFGVKNGVKVDIEKRIPVAAGLGGGSSNAAITFIALKSLWNLEMDAGYMAATASDFGSDITFFFSGGLARGEGRGEKITLLPDGREWELLLANPGIQISSREAYELAETAVTVHSGSMLWFNGLQKGITNKYPAVKEMLNKMKELGAQQVMMSGSGATCIGLYDNKDKQHRALEFLLNRGIWCRLVKTLGRSQYQKCIQSLS